MRKSDIQKLRFTNGGLFSSQRPWKHGTRVIDSFELIIVTKGTVYMYQADREYTLSAGDYLLLSPNTIHGGTRTSQMPVSFYWLHFQPDAPNGMAWPRGFGALPDSGRLTNLGAVLESARQLLHCAESLGYPEDTCQHMMYVLLAELLHQVNGAEADEALAVRVHEHVRAHAWERICACQVAEYFGYHPDHLARTMKKNYGRTLQQDIILERLHCAKLLLQTTDDTVAKIALELGYEDPVLFEKFFKYHMKVTPKTYRNSFLKRHTNHI